VAWNKLMTSPSWSRDVRANGGLINNAPDQTFWRDRSSASPLKGAGKWGSQL